MSRAAKGRERQHAANSEHQRSYVGSADDQYEVVDSAHLIQAEQPQLIATRTPGLLQAAT